MIIVSGPTGSASECLQGSAAGYLFLHLMLCKRAFETQPKDQAFAPHYYRVRADRSATDNDTGPGAKRHAHLEHGALARNVHQFCCVRFGSERNGHGKSHGNSLIDPSVFLRIEREVCTQHLNFSRRNHLQRDRFDGRAPQDV